MIYQTRKLESGFTLIEVVMSVFVFSMIVVGLISLVSSIIVSSGKQGLLTTGQDQARKFANTFTNELRNAVYGSTGGYPIAQADNQTLVFYSNVDGGTDIEKVRYFVSSGTLRKGVTKYVGGVYSAGNEVVTVLQNDLGNSATPLFYYYDGTYDGTSNNFLTQPVNINNIAYIRLNLMIINKAGVTNTNTYTVNAGAAIRNLKTNL